MLRRDRQVGMWYTTKELADLLCVSERTIRRRAKKGEWETKEIHGRGGSGGSKYKIWYEQNIEDTIADTPKNENADKLLRTPNDTITDIADTLDNPLSDEIPLRQPADRNEKSGVGLGNGIISVGLIAGISKLMKDEYRKILYYWITKGLTQYETGRILGKSKAYIKNREFEMREAGIRIPSQSGKRQSLYIETSFRRLPASN